MVTDGPPCERHAFDHVGIERALREKFRTPDFRASCSKTSMKSLPMVLRFCSGSSDSSERLEEGFGSIHVHKRNVVAVAKERHHFLRFREPHQAMVHEHAS
jgi:hypothetical protein